jgi:DNA-binding CsgD family transcriptional regulator
MRLVDILRDRLARAEADGGRLLPRHCSPIVDLDHPLKSKSQQPSRRKPSQRFRNNAKARLRFTPKQARAIQAMQGTRTYKEIAKEMNCSTQTVYAVIHGKGAYGHIR